MTDRSEPVPQTLHYASGTVKMTGSILDGEMHGDRAWYRTDATVMRAGSFDRGRQIGPWRTFDRAGRLVKETKFAVRAGSE